MITTTQSEPLIVTSQKPVQPNCRLRILFACYDLKIGGHSSHTLNFGRALRKRGHTVGVLVPEPFGELYPEFRETLNDILILRRGIETRSAYVHKVVEHITSWSPDAIINNVVPQVQAAMPLLPSSIFRISVVHSIHEREGQISLANLDCTDRVVAVSDNIRAGLEKQTQHGAKFVTIPVGLEIPAHQSSREKAVHPLRLIYVGRIEPEKNLSGLLQVLSALYKTSVPFHMTIVGDGNEMQSVRRSAEAEPFSKQVCFLGVRTPAEVSQLLDDHDFLLLTSHYEGTPHAALEAMAHGLVVLASRLPGATDRIITDGVNGFLCDRNKPEEFVKILARFSSSPADFTAISKTAQQTISARFSADALAEQYESLLLEPRDRQARTQKKSAKEVRFPPELLPYFPGILLQLKHRCADAWRYFIRGQRSVLLVSASSLPVKKTCPKEPGSEQAEQHDL